MIDRAYRNGRLVMDSKQDLVDEIERLRERCEAYKGQVEAGANEIERLHRLIMDQGIKAGLLLAALGGIDDLAVSHVKGGIGKAQKIARDAMHTYVHPPHETQTAKD